MSSEPGADDEHVERQDGSRTPITQILGRIVLAVVVVLFLVFAAANAHYVDFSWIFGETRATFDGTGGHVEGGVRLILLLLASFVIGLFVGVLLTWQEGRRKRRAARRAS